MKKKLIHIFLTKKMAMVGVGGMACFASASSSMFTVYPKEYPNALANPMKGFRPDLGEQAFRHEYATLVRHYIKWNEIENDETDGIEKIRDYCNKQWAGIEELGIKVIPRVYLDWDSENGNEYWPADMVTGDYSSEQFEERVKRLIARLGEVWDDDPRVAWVQMGIIGYWGEHHNPGPTQRMQTILGDAFSTAFSNKLVLVRHPNEFSDYEVGYYWDSWAHIDQTFNINHGEGIEKVNEEFGRWKTCPIEGEVAYNWGNYRKQPGTSPDETLSNPNHRDFLLDSIRNLHCTALGWICNYDADIPAVKAGAEEVQKAFGYRFTVPEISCSREVNPGGELRLKFKVVNTGSAPFYEKWPVEFSLLNRSTREPVWRTTLGSVDIREWIPGDDWDEVHNEYRKPAPTCIVDITILLPDENQLPAGIYVAALAVLDPVGREPALRFAIENCMQDGRHPFGFVGVGVNVIGDQTLKKDAFPDPMETGRLPYALKSDDKHGIVQMAEILP